MNENKLRDQLERIISFADTIGNNSHRTTIKYLAKEALSAIDEEPEQVRPADGLWEVWTEGYSITGGESGAMFHGKFPGETFTDAVEAWVKTLDEDGQSYFNKEHMRYWGCSFFDNESDARKSFG